MTGPGDRPPGRRQVLAGAAAALLAVPLAGCLPGDEEDEPDRPDPDLLLRARVAEEVRGLAAQYAAVIARFPAGLAIYSITTSFWSLGQQVTFWRLSAAVPAGTAAVVAEVEDVAEAGEDSRLEEALERQPAAPEARQHSRSKKKKRSRSRR